MILHKLAGIAGGLFLLAIVFTLLERRWPAIPGQRWWKAGSRVDLYYWLFTPFITRAISTAAVFVAVVLAALLLGAPRDKAQFEIWLEARRAIVSRQPPSLQLIEALFLIDLIGYWSHRLFHKEPLWRFHAVHHAPRELDWLSAVRVHPVNEVLPRILQTVPLFFMGFRPGVLAGVAPLVTFYAIMIHANLSWSFGPLRYLIASPVFHRWHHTSERDGLDKNFAGLFPFFDLVFGTFYMPKDRQPLRFGIEGEQIPEGFWAQLIHPFRRKPRRAESRPQGA